jgi:hypothetical protein
LKEKLQLVPDEDPCGCAVAFPPIRTLDFIEWNSNDDETDPGFLFMPSVIVSEIQCSPYALDTRREASAFLVAPSGDDSDQFDELISPCGVIPKGDCTVPVPEVVTHGVIVSGVSKVSVNAHEDRSDYSNDSVFCVIDESFLSDQE